MTNKELLQRIKDILPSHEHQQLIRHISGCVWWKTGEGCSCTPVYVIEVYAEPDGTVQDLEPMPGGICCHYHT